VTQFTLASGEGLLKLDFPNGRSAAEIERSAGGLLWCSPARQTFLRDGRFGNFPNVCGHLSALIPWPMGAAPQRGYARSAARHNRAEARGNSRRSMVGKG